MDLAKYHALFLEEATENLSEMSTSLLDLEKEPASSEAIDAVFRTAHSIKGMAASLDYASITEVAHALEDRMHVVRDVGRVADGEEMAVLFRGLDGLQAMVAALRENGEPPPPEPELVEVLANVESAAEAPPETAPKKSPSR